MTSAISRRCPLRDARQSARTERAQMARHVSGVRGRLGQRPPEAPDLVERGMNGRGATARGCAASGIPPGRGLSSRP